MIYERIDYPLSHVTIHRDPDCPYLEDCAWAHRRKVRLDVDTFSGEVKALAQGDYRFASKSGRNSLWLEIDFADQEFELAAALFVQRLLGQRYKRIREARVSVCCPVGFRADPNPR